MQIFDEESLLDEFGQAMRYLAQGPGDHHVTVVYGSKSKDRENQVQEGLIEGPKEGSRLHLSYLSLVPKPPTDPAA